jgi:GNAT superfamily N-acetyltransferase
MIWSDPWIDIATTRTKSESPYCTLLPPQRVPLPPNIIYQSMTIADLPIHDWKRLVGTRFENSEIERRLQGAWIPCLWLDNQLIATCVLRPQAVRDVNLWVVETLVVHTGYRGQGYGRMLMREFMTWVWRCTGPFVLGFTWELTLTGLLSVYRNGWYKAIASLEYGWGWWGVPRCFEDHTETSEKVTESVIVTDSGLGDRTGFVVSGMNLTGVCWSCVAQRGGWKSLWCHAAKKPERYDDPWGWSREWIAIGFLNANHPEELPTQWGTSDLEITAGGQ